MCYNLLHHSSPVCRHNPLPVRLTRGHERAKDSMIVCAFSKWFHNEIFFHNGCFCLTFMHQRERERTKDNKDRKKNMAQKRLQYPASILAGLCLTEKRLKRNRGGRKMTTRELMTVGFWSWWRQRKRRRLQTMCDSKRCTQLLLVTQFVQSFKKLDNINIVLLPYLVECCSDQKTEAALCVCGCPKLHNSLHDCLQRRRGSTFLSFSIVVGVNSKMLKWMLYRIKWWRCTNAFRLKGFAICCDIIIFLCVMYIVLI